jgi:GAF domain-containing protein
MPSSSVSGATAPGDDQAPDEAGPAGGGRAGVTVTVDEVSASIAELQQLLLETQSVEDFLQGLVRLAARLVVDGLSCGMTLEPSGKPLTAACSDDVASQVDEIQFFLGEGPSLEAVRQRGPVSIADTAADSPWPKFAEQAAAYGIRSCLSLPLVVDGKPIGALNLYSPAPRAFGTEQTARAESFARNASAALAIATRLASYTALTNQLRASLATRGVIDQALGIVMAQQHCSQSEAFAILRTASQNRNVKLREVAKQIVARVSGKSPDPPPFNGV